MLFAVFRVFYAEDVSVRHSGPNREAYASQVADGSSNQLISCSRLVFGLGCVCELSLLICVLDLKLCEER